MDIPRPTSKELLVDIEKRHEIIGIFLASVTILLWLAFISYDATSEANWIGPAGRGTASVLFELIGFASWILPIELSLATTRCFRGQPAPLGSATAASTLVFVTLGCALIHLTFGGVQIMGGHLASGVLGEVTGEVLKAILGTAGALVSCIAFLLVTFVLRTRMSVIRFSRWAAQHLAHGSRKTSTSMISFWRAWREARELDEIEIEEDASEAQPTPHAPRVSRTRAQIGEEAVAEEDDDKLEETTDPELEAEISEVVATQKPIPKKRSRAPKVVDPVHAQDLESHGLPSLEQKPATNGSSNQTPFVLPPTTLLDKPSVRDVQVDEVTLTEKAARLVDKLAAYGVQGRVDEIHPGPVVTMYEFEPQSGTKVSKIAGLADDLAMALAAQKVRIVAPIPGKARVGFELPNEQRQTVSLREILEDPRWHKPRAVPMALGKDIGGQPVYGDLARMPHLLVAGATGSGKSVALNVILASLLMKKSPEEVRLLMIDPKVVELQVFDGIPHMLLPVVTDMKKAALALRWAVDEMERRYQMFADAGARNLVTYNERVEKVLRGELDREKLSLRRNQDTAAASDAAEKPLDKLPYIVVVVDEFADLMMVAAKDVESAIARLAQKARAAGIHVILATQRPSVDVITGMIKANFPARVAFKVSQREDSKTILGRSGAEHLLGMGDMLIIPPGSSDLQRVHGAYISEDEVHSVCDFLRAQGKPIYQEEILKPRDDEDEDGISNESASNDPLYDRAVAVVAQAGYCSISHIQRQLGVGYNKAAKLVERMEKENVVGPPSGKAGGRREVLVQAL